MYNAGTAVKSTGSSEKNGLLALAVGTYHPRSGRKEMSSNHPSAKIPISLRALAPI
jgi:hypothetical protein